MFGLFLSLVITVLAAGLSGKAFPEALAMGAGFLFFWTLVGSLLFAGVGLFLLLVGGAILLRLPGPIRAFLAPLALTGGVKAMISRPVVAWMGSVILVLWGTWILRLQPGGVDVWIGIWCVTLGFVLRSLAWSSLKLRSRMGVFTSGEFNGETSEDSPSDPEIVGQDPGEQARFQQAQTVVAESLPEDESKRP